MIPKIIHYCWFGGKPLPKSAIKCINSWKKFFPDYEIREWNESNFDVDMIPYTQEAYAAKKYAFVSDFARFWVLHEHGGVYFDTDVEVIRPVDDIISKGSFMGYEKLTSSSQKSHYIAPGLGLACEPKHELWSDIIKTYQDLQSFSPDKQGTVCSVISNVLKCKGVKLDGLYAVYPFITLYPADYFCPQSMMGAPIEITENTRTIHHYDCSWLPWYVRYRVLITTELKNLLK